MIKKLQDKWKVKGWQLVLILTTFALGGSLCARVGNWLLSFVLSEKNLLYWIMYVPLITLLWPICVLLISIPLGQFRFFKNYLHRVAIKTGIIRNSGNGKVRLALFASGAGTNARKILEHFRNSDTVEVVLLVCNRPGAGAITVAAEYHVPVLMIEKNDFEQTGYVKELRNYQVNFIALAGFLWKIPPSIIAAFPHSIINVHPALLPRFGGKGMYGENVHKAVLKEKEKESGITIHYVDEVYDHGEIIFQARCPVLETDNPEALASRIHELEHRHYPVVLEQLLAKR